jgi:hypothetical protein
MGAMDRPSQQRDRAAEASRSAVRRVIRFVAGIEIVCALATFYLAAAWFKIDEGENITSGLGVIVWYGCPVLGFYCALAALRARQQAPGPRRVVPTRPGWLILAGALSLVGWWVFYWLGTDHGVVLQL